MAQENKKDWNEKLDKKNEEIEKIQNEWKINFDQKVKLHIVE